MWGDPMATTADGHRVRAYGRLIICHHPTCCAIDDVDRTGEGVIVGQPPQQYVTKGIALHVSQHNGSTQSA